MISITSHVTGGHIASEMADDMEEAAQFFPEFAAALTSIDKSDLKDMLGDELFADHRRAAVLALGELLIEAAKS